jgi:hypothetical protein
MKTISKMDIQGSGRGCDAMVPAFEYVHAIDGRLRIKVPEVRRSPTFARRVEDLFRSVEGIREVRANPITGNVLFLHDPGTIHAREIMAGLIAAGYMGMGIDGGKSAAGDVAELATTIAEWVCWALLRAFRGFDPGQHVVEWLIQAGARLLLRLLAGRTAPALA